MPTTSYLDFPQSTGDIKKRNAACTSTKTSSSRHSPTPSKATPSLSCAPTTGPGVKQSDLSSTVSSFCDSIDSAGVSLTSDGVDSGPYYRGNTASYSITLVKGSYKLSQDECKKIFGSLVNGCAPFKDPDRGDFLKYGGSTTVKGHSGSAKFSLSITAPVAIGAIG